MDVVEFGCSDDNDVVEFGRRAIMDVVEFGCSDRMDVSSSCNGGHLKVRCHEFATYDVTQREQ